LVTLHTIINNHNCVRYRSSAIGHRSVSTYGDTRCWSDSIAVWAYKIAEKCDNSPQQN